MLKNKNQILKSKNNKRFMFIVFAFFLQSLFISNINAADSVSVGVVNVTFLMENAPQSEIASVKLKSKFSSQETKLAADLREINVLELELNEIKVSKEKVELQRQKERELRTRKRIRGRSLQDFREELRFARDVALDEVQKEVFRAIDQVRKQKKIDIVLQDYISASKSVDITPAVLEYLKSKASGSDAGTTIKPVAQ
ncbi:MAG: outer membrane protein [Cocleimonas sp.]|jgi:outer membrane protein